MKFGKSLSSQVEDTIPEWRDKFLSYKELKRRLKLIGGDRPPKRARVCAGADADASDDCSDSSSSNAPNPPFEEADFLCLLEAELEKFNNFFVEKEEEYIIRQKELQERVARAAVAAPESKEELTRVRKEIVDFHGEMVLLENYSALNYTGLVKILKKYDKRTGALIRLPFIQKVLRQPFFTTDLLYKLVKQCERMLDMLFPATEASPRNEAGSAENGNNPGAPPANGNCIPDLGDIENMESMYVKSTVAALKSLKEIRSKSSTVSIFSLPPLQSNAFAGEDP